MTARKRLCVHGHIIDGVKVGRGGKPRRYCRQCNVLQVSRSRRANWMTRKLRAWTRGSLRISGLDVS